MADTYKTFKQMREEIIDRSGENQNEDNYYLHLFNSAIREINMRCGSVFPEQEITKFNEEYKALPNPWTELILIWGMYSIYQAEQEPQLGASWLSRFDNYLRLFEQKYLIPEEYQSDNYQQFSVQRMDWKNSAYQEKEWMSDFDVIKSKPNIKPN